MLATIFSCLWTLVNGLPTGTGVEAGTGGSDRILPEWVVVTFAIAGNVLAGAAAVIMWVIRQRDKERAKREKAREKEDKRYGISYPQAMAELNRQLQTVTEGFNRLQTEHVECRENLARQETRAAIQEDRVLQMEREVNTLKRRFSPDEVE